MDKPSWPADVTFLKLEQDSAREVHDLLLLAYSNGGGSVAPFSEWWPGLLSDSEFDASLCFLVRDGDGIVGFAQCWTSAFIKDLVVHPRRRNEGIGQSLLLHAFEHFRRLGASAVDLKVEEQNTKAIRLYLKSGMHIVDP